MQNDADQFSESRPPAENLPVIELPGTDTAGDEEDEQSVLSKILLRAGLAAMMAVFGFALVILGYAYALIVVKQALEFSAYPGLYFLISVFLWIVIGLVAPAGRMAKMIDAVRSLMGSTGASAFGRFLLYFLLFGVLVILYWYFLTFCVMGAATVFFGA